MKGDDQVKPRSEIPELLSRECWNCKSNEGFKIIGDSDKDTLNRPHPYNLLEVECKNCGGYLIYLVEKK